MKVILTGISGHMGKEVLNLADAKYKNLEVVYGIDINATGNETIPCVKYFKDANPPKDAECIVDFSHHSCTNDLIDFAVNNHLPLVLATTGQTDEEKAKIQEGATKVPIFFAANYSVGIALLVELAKKTASVFPEAEIEIVEKHHDRKIDAPSGTALTIANAIKEVRNDATFNCGRSGQAKRTKEEIGIHAIRMGNIVGEHEVLVGTNNQTITLKHEAHSRALFAEGAITAAEFVIGKPAKLYNMQDMIKF